MQTIALIDYGSGNLRSAEKALWEAARRLGKRRDIRATADPDFVARADRIVLPGVGAFAACMRALSARDGLIEAMSAGVKRGAPFLGVCVGMQLLATRGLEFGETAGLGWIPGDVAVLKPADPALKVPHMGWNNIQAETPSALFDAVAGQDFYFTHSFAFTPSNRQDIAASVDHGGRFAAAVARDNIAGVQFHPEKSQATGLALIAKFLEWKP
jgi:imidazole glycerol-phosphate synthase subunit HisH